MASCGLRRFRTNYTVNPVHAGSAGTSLRDFSATLRPHGTGPAVTVELPPP
jgi:hypothetical protein